MRRGHKDSREDFRQRIQSGLGLTFDIEAARRLAKEALEQLIDWNAQDEALAAVLNPVWEEAFQAGARSMEEAFGIKALQAPRLTDYLRQYGLERVKGINATTRDKLFYPQLGVKLCSMAGGGVQKIYMVFLREPSRQDRSGSDLFHLRDGFEIKMNFDRNVSCFIFVNALMHDDFFD